MGEAVVDEVFDHVRESVVVRSLDGGVLVWNKASEALYGYTRAQVIGESLDGLLQTRSDLSPADIAQHLRAEGQWEGQLRRRAANGAEIVVSASLSLRRPADGRPDEVFETCRDITAQLKAERALKAAERRYTNLFQAMAASFWELDFNPVGAMLRHLRKQGVESYGDYFEAHPAFVREMMRATQIVDVNDETVRLFGGGDRSVMDGSIEPYWPEASSDVFAASVVAAVGGAPSFSTETRLRRHNGTEFEALFTACFPAESVARGALLIGVIDISERLRAQRAERQLRDEFAHAARISMLGELTASIAHEVNQPLAAISAGGAAGLRWLNRDPPDIGRTTKLTENIIADAQRAADIIARIRRLATKQSATVCPLDLVAVLEETGTFLRHELQGHEAELSLDLPGDLPPILADRTQLQQVFANLIINAAHAMRQARSAERRITIAARLFDTRWVEVEVADTGPGVAPDMQGRLFQSFYTTKPEGLGIGLSICRTILEQVGGEIEARNQAVGGACFLVRLSVAGCDDAEVQGA